ncbi:MAG: DUF2157 domain-containing protein [Candidatus Omnitrophica bacterium]|nr:DUF2157 domain-containing protein [Candidatus Omnitrophota bacterium]
MDNLKEILAESVRQGIISGEQSNKILGLQATPSINGEEQKRGFNSIMAFYYFGAMIIIFAFTYFLSSQWNYLSTGTILFLGLAFQAVCFGIGMYLRKKLNYLISGGLLISAAVAITPLVIYCLEKMFGIWPLKGVGSDIDYHSYWMLIKPCWIYIEFSTLVVAALVLYWVRFSFLALIIGHTAWFLSMDLAEFFLSHSQDWNSYMEVRKWISILIGATMIGVAKLFNRRTKEDYSMWLFLYGVMIFSGATAMTWLEHEGTALLFFIVHIAFVVMSILWQRKSLLIFGAIGVYAYLAHLAYDIFKNSPFFPIALALIGLLMILSTVSFQRNKDKILAQFVKR